MPQYRSSDVGWRRLSSQKITGPRLAQAADLVAWLGAVQAQDYLGSLWAIGLRLEGATETAVEEAVTARAIVRTWPMRGTLHFVAAADVRWMLELLTPRVIAATAGRHRQLELDEAVFRRSRKVFIRALDGGKQLTRPAIYRALGAAGIATGNSRGLHILGQLAHELLICFGAREGKQPTFTLFDEWVPNARRRPREEALGELARRYFASHGPATVQDFSWWSGLVVSDAREGIELAGRQLLHESIEGRDHWFASSQSDAGARSTVAHLLPAWDEYAVAYRDRNAILDPAHAKRVNAGGGVLNPIMVIGGRVIGTWRRRLARGSVVVTLKPFKPPAKAERRAFGEAADRYGAFLGLPAAVEVATR